MDPFEITQQDYGAPSPPPLGSRSLSDCRCSKLGAGMQLLALSVISYQWIAGKIPVAWHAVVALIAVMLPTSDLTDLAKGAIRAYARRK